MLKKLLLFYHTIRFLKREQLFFQIWYKVKGLLPINRQYSKYDFSEIRRLTLRDFCINSKEKYLGNNRFCFLNLEHAFYGKVSWSYLGKGKLWNYNLQYFDYLLDEACNDLELVALVGHCAYEILSGRLKLEPYPVSLRVVNWLLYYSLSGYSSEIFLKAIKRQIGYLEQNQEYHIQANHLLENKIALFIAAIFLDETKLLERSADGLIKQIEIQILPDGAHYECSPMYHCIILSKLLLIKQLLVDNDISTKADLVLDDAIVRMAGWLQSICFGDGTYPLLNDAAPGIALTQNELFLWIKKIGLQSGLRNLEQCGYRKMSNKVMEVILDMGDIQPTYQPGHAHADMLSFCMNLNNKPFFVDPGISTYEASQQRTLERSTSFHNTVCINNTNQSEIWATFRVARRALIKVLKDTNNHVVASHDGYLRKYGVLHERSFELTERQFVICDYIRNNSKNLLISTANFYTAPGIIVKKVAEDEILLSNEARISFTGAKNILIELVMIPAGYNNLVNSYRIAVNFDCALRTIICAE